MLLTAHGVGFGSVLPLHNVTRTWLMNMEGTRNCPLACVKEQHNQQHFDNEKLKARSASHFGGHAMS